MLKLSACLAPVACVALLTGCPKKSNALAFGDDGAVADVGDAAPPAPAPPVAKNSAEVARFPAEKPIADDDAKTLDIAQARTGPKSGNNVAMVKAGSDPFKIAEFQDCFLVTFPDPKDAASTLMGWIPKAAFTTVLVHDVHDAGPKDASSDAAGVVAPVKCPAGQETVVNVVGAAGVCRRKCTADKDCKNPAPSACQTATTLANKVTKVCVNETP